MERIEVNVRTKEKDTIKLTQVEVDAANVNTQAEAAYMEANGYKVARLEAYGSIGDQLDMIYKDQVNSTSTFKDHVASVKTAHPKP